MNPTRWKLSSATVLNVVQTLAIILGIAFGIRELRELQRSRELAATVSLVGLYQNEGTSTGITRLLALPRSLSEEEFSRQPLEDRDRMMSLLGTWESLGILVHRGEVSLELADELFGGPVLLTWERLRPLVMITRERENNPHALEWFQWLVERLQEHRAQPGVAPAYEKYRDWTP